jgi:hypothetical protein
MARIASSIRRPAFGLARRKLRFELLEDRRVLANITVTSLNDAPLTGPDSETGTLRWAISEANNTAEPDVIKFAEELSGNLALSLIGNIDANVGPSALLVSSAITIAGNANGITITRAPTATDRRLFHVAATGTLTFESITLHGGTARGENGGPGQNGQNAFGGAVYNQGMLTIVASTLDGNSAVGGNAGTGGVGGSAFGGAIYNDGGTLTIHNSTLSGNSVSGGTGISSPLRLGGAVYSKNGFLRVYNSTLTNNSATSGRQLYIIGVGAGQTANAEIYSSIVAQADVNSQAYDINATDDQGGTIVVTGGNNLIRFSNVPPSIIVSSDDPLLGGLANNGGPTFTHALSAGSPAIGQGSNPQNFANDQRGNSFSRVAGGTIDIGAFELQTVASPSLPGDYNQNEVVDAADYVVWRKTFGSGVPQYSGADGNGTSTIDAGDYDVWRGNFGATPAAAASVALSGGTAHTDVAASPNGRSLIAPLDEPVSRPTPTRMNPRETVAWEATNDHETSLFDRALLELSSYEARPTTHHEWIANHFNSQRNGLASETDDNLQFWFDCELSRSLRQTASHVAASIYTA